MEKEVQSTVPYLDMCIERSSTIPRKVFRKDTHSGQYLNFLSNNSKSIREEQY